MQITEVRVYPTDEDQLRGYASITLDNSWMVRDLRIVRKASGELYVAMPTRKQLDGTYREIVCPITAEARQTIEKAILEMYAAICGSQSPPRKPHHD